MKYILKTIDFNNLPETRPLVAMDKDGNLIWLNVTPPSPEATLLYGSKDSTLYPIIDLEEYYEYVGTIEIEGVTKYQYNKQGDKGYCILTDTRDFSNISFDNPYHVTDYYTTDGAKYYTTKDHVIYYGGTTEPTVIYESPVYHDTTNMNANGHEYVDLGLPSGTKWATMNVGANVSTGYGEYYAWGETSIKSNYSWSTYEFGQSQPFTKYDPKTDNLVELQMSDDVAKVNWGGDWHMPNTKLIFELLYYTTNEWIEDYNGSGVNGRLFTSTINGNQLFIPASGYSNGESLNVIGSYCYLWSSSLYLDDSSYACYLYFGSDSIYIGYDNRCDGFTVRPVLY